MYKRQGLFLVKAGGALIDNMAILFVIGVGVGMSEKNDGTGGDVYKRQILCSAEM